MDRSKQSAGLPRRIRDLFNRRGFGALYLFATLEVLHLLTRLGPNPKEDGWRKFYTAFLRTEDSRFTLAIFKLRADSSSKKDILEKISRWLMDYPHPWNTRLAWTRHGAHVEPNRRYRRTLSIISTSRNLVPSAVALRNPNGSTTAP